MALCAWFTTCNQGDAGWKCRADIKCHFSVERTQPATAQHAQQLQTLKSRIAEGIQVAKDETTKHAQQLKAARANAALHAQQIRALEQQAQQQAPFLQEQAEEHAQQLKAAKAAKAHHVEAARDKAKQESQTASCLGCISTACTAGQDSTGRGCTACSATTSSSDKHA